MDVSLLVMMVTLITVGLLVGGIIGNVYRRDGFGKLTNALIGVAGIFLGLALGTIIFGLERPLTFPSANTFVTAVIGSILTVLLANWLRRHQYTNR